MAVDLQFTDANINNYTDIPTSAYGVLSGVSLTAVTVNHSTKQIIDGIVPDGNDVYIRWKYPVSDNNYVRVAVGYQLQVIEGNFTSAQAQAPRAPGAIVYEEISNLKDAADPENRYINLQGSVFGRVDIPTNVLKGGVRYTVRVRALLFSELGSGLVSGQYFKYSEYGVTNFRVNNIPAAINLRTNGASNPTALSANDDVKFSFTFSDIDGPAHLYRIQVGTTSGGGFSANIWDSGLISAGKNFGSRDYTVPYTGPALSQNVTYAWRVQVNDSLSDGGYTSATDTFKINTLPTVSSLEIDGEEILFGEIPTVASTGATLEWVFSDTEGDTQRAYNLEVVQVLQSQLVSDDFVNDVSLVSTTSDAFELLATGNVFSTSTSVVLPTLPEGGTIEVRLKVRDSVEFGDQVVASFKVNATPSVLDLKTDSEDNPGDVGTTTPTFSWTFFDATAGDIQRAYRIQVATSDTFATLLWDTGEVTSNASSVVYGSTASPTVAAAALSHGQYYYVRVKASDGTSFSEYANGFFAINTRPESPSLLTPSSGAYSGNMSVTWLSGGADADGDTITYTLEITNRRSSNRGWEFLAGPFPSTTTSYTLDLSTIKAGSDYGIRVIANDGYSDSDPADGGTSAVNAVGLGFTILNHAPTTPTFLLPSTGQVVSSILKAEWIEGSPVDVDGDAVYYVVEITKDSTVTTPVYEKVAVVREGSSRTLIDVSDLPDGTKYKLRITAYDDKGGIGTTNTSNMFGIVNTPAVMDFERLGANLYLGTSDGKVFKATEAIWQVEEDFGTEDYSQFEKFVRGTPNVKIDKGSLVIESPVGSTFILRIGR